MRDTKTIGSILLDVELVTTEDIDQALDIQKQTGKRLGEVLVGMGLVSDDDIRWALAEQLNLPYVNIRKDQIDLDVATLIPEKLARRYHVIPILKIEHELTVVVDDPLNTTIINDIERITKAQVKISLGRTSDILLAIDEIYGFTQDTRQHELDSPPQFTSSWFSDDAMQRILNDLSGQDLLEYILTVALQHEVTHIHFQPGDTVCQVKYRVNAGLQEQIRLNTEWYSILLFRLKIRAGVEITELTRPLTAECSYQFTREPPEGVEEQVTLAVSVLPTVTGEAVVLRFINKPVESLWMLREDEERTPLQQKEVAEFHHLRSFAKNLTTGAVFLGGASCWDTSSTLYALLEAFDPVHKKIVTLESTSEYRADTYTQTRYRDKENSHQKRDDKKPDSSSSLFHPDQQGLSVWIPFVKDQDADILLVDQIANPAVVAYSLEFAAQGLLFASLGQHHVFDMLAYLLDCHIEPSVVASRVSALMAQHTVRLLCEHCKQKDSPDEWKQRLDPFQMNGDTSKEDSPDVYAPQGCPECNMSGYADHVVLFEHVLMEPWLKEELRSGRSLRETQRAAEERGFVSLRKKSVDLFYAGLTSFEDVFSIIT